MKMKILTLVLVAAVCTHAEDVKETSNRQKRLLFFDENGSLVKTYSNPYMNNLAKNAERVPFYGNLLNPFFNFLWNFGENLVTYTIPVSNAIIQSIRDDPKFQNTLVMIPKKDPVVEPNPLCQGKRTQIPAPNQCNNFLNCWDGWAFEQECPTGLLFSTQGYCDYADNVDCHNRNLPEKPQEQPICSKDFEAFRNQQNCNEFFICVNRQPIPFKCPADLAYSQILGVCDYADRVDCKSTGSPIIATQPSYPTPASPIIPAADPAPPSDSSSPSPSAPSPPSSGLSPSPSPVFPPAPPSSSLSPSPSPAFPIVPPSSGISPSPSPAFPPVLPPSGISPLPPSLPSFPLPPFPSIPSIPPVSSLLPPGSFPPSLISQLFPSQRPLPVDIFPAPIENLQKPSDDEISSIFRPACSNDNVAMSRQDAIRLLQKANISN